MRDVLSVGARAREIPWSESLPDDLSPAQRDRLGRDWLHRMEQEHLAVGAFSMITQELAEVGCEPTMLALMAKAICDEVRHTEICRRLALAAWDGRVDVPSSFRGVPSIPRHANAPLAVRALLHAVEMCCLGETCTGVYLTAMHEHATHPTAHRALEALLEDEIDHGRVGWALLATASDAAKKVVAAHLPSMAERTVGAVLGSRLARERVDEALLPHGYVPGEEAVSLYRGALRDVLLPGFEANDVDVRPLRALCTVKGWA